MGTAGEITAELYAAYRNELNAERMTGYVRLGTMVALVLQTCFVMLDWYAYPEQFPLFFTIRMILNVLLGIIFFRTSVTHPVHSAIVLCLVMGSGMLALIYGANATESGYYAGLILVLTGMGVMLPLTALQSAGICAALVVAYAAAPLFAVGPVEWGTFALHLVFLGAAGCMSVASCAFLDRVRAKEFAQRRAIEQARDALAQLDVEKSRFTANVHHELRTPLTLLLAPLESILGGEFGEVPAVQRGYLKTMHNNSLRLLKLINNLLDLAKIEGQERRVVRRPVQVGRFVSELVTGARPLAERRKVELRTLGLEALPLVHVDPDALDKVFVNLLGNALKFTDPDGWVEVSGEVEGQGVRLVVADSGIGVPQDQLEKIFDRFAQVDGSSTRRHEGTGIGLALVRELVELHGGRIHAESDGEGCGTRMVLDLPTGEPDLEEDEELLSSDDGQSVALGNSIAAMESELDVAPADHEEAAPEQAGSGRQTAGADGEDEIRSPYSSAEVLICEDNPDMRRLLAHFVGKEFRVRSVTNGREGLDALRERAPDLVLTDVMMPEMSGTELCRAIKTNPETHGIPVVLVTSKAEREMKIEGLELGADDYVTKPFHPRELMARVRALVKLRRLQQELSVQNARLGSTNVELQATLSELREATVQLAQAERLAAVGELAAGVAHEVNNPVNFAMNSLRTLRGYVDDVRSVAERIAALDLDDRAALDRELRELEKLRDSLHFDDLADTLSELVDIVTEGLERTHRLVADLRDLAAPGTGRQPDVDIARGLETTLQLVKHAFQDAGVTLEADVSRSLPRLECDASALNQVFLNLLKNASEALAGRGGTVRTCARQEGDAIIVSVGDDGPGMPAEVQQQIFEPFFSTKGAGQGAGLGLSISRRVAAEHGGSLEVHSASGAGTTFTLTLPVGGSDRAPQA
jgi:signal transduction histidine kinase